VGFVNPPNSFEYEESWIEFCMEPELIAEGLPELIALPDRVQPQSTSSSIQIFK
jgi:hypothetical protein